MGCKACNECQWKRFGYTKCPVNKFYRTQWSTRRIYLWLYKMVVLFYWIYRVIRYFILLFTEGAINNTAYLAVSTGCITAYFFLSTCLAHYGLYRDTSQSSKCDEVRTIHKVVWIVQIISFGSAFSASCNQILENLLPDEGDIGGIENKHDAVHFLSSGCMVLDVLIVCIPVRLLHFYQNINFAILVLIAQLIVHYAGLSTDTSIQYEEEIDYGLQSDIEEAFDLAESRTISPISIALNTLFFPIVSQIVMFILYKFRRRMHNHLKYYAVLCCVKREHNDDLSVASSLTPLAGEEKFPAIAELDQGTPIPGDKTTEKDVNPPPPTVIPENAIASVADAPGEQLGNAIDDGTTVGVVDVNVNVPEDAGTPAEKPEDIPQSIEETV